MTTAEIREKINYYEDIIENINNEKINIDEQLDELELLRDKIINLQGNFATMQETRQNKVTNKTTKEISNNIFSKYLSGMKEMLTGKEFVDAYEGLTTAKQKINSEIQILLDDIDDCDTRLSYNEEQKTYWQEQLLHATE